MDLSEIERIFHEALQYDTGRDRMAFLQKACGDDQALRQQMEQLLTASEDASSFLSSPTQTQPTASTPDMSGALVGRYRLLRELGEGGFGKVYEAEQLEPIKRHVALKIIKLGLDTRQVVARFEAERQALALMDHPHIAKVLDAGAIPQWRDRPYFVMELVRGIPLTHYCDENRLSTRERLELFIKVCQAVQHAHQKGIIHRDLKPSNILVSRSDPESRGEPKIIDFGIAKATQQELTENTAITELHQMLGTPAYMSPEQADINPGSAGDIDTRTDIYSLGVLLYEVLTGQTPFDSRELLRKGLDEVRRCIREEEPVPPSTRARTMRDQQRTTIARCRQTAPDRLGNDLKGDLDWIVMRALEKDRARRYPTAQDLAHDLQRHLNQEPVEAAAPSLAYRSSKFLRRHKMAIASGVAIAGLLILGTAMSAWQAIRATAAREDERVAKEDALAANNKATMALHESRRVKAELALDKAQLLGESGDAHLALLWLVRSLKLAPDNAHDLRRVIRHAMGGWQKHVSPLRLLMPHEQRVDRVAFSPDGKSFFTAARIQNRGVRLQRWDAGDGHPLSDPLDYSAGMVYALEFSRDAAHLALGYIDGRFDLIDCETGNVRPIELSPASGAITAISFNPDHSLLVIASSFKTGVVVQPDDDLDESTSTALSEQGNVVHLVDVRTGEQVLAKPLAFKQPILALAFSPDAQTFVTETGPRIDLGATGHARFWNLRGEELREPWVHKSPVMSVAWSPDGNRLLTGHWDFSARLWDVASGGLLREVFSTAPMSAVDFNPVSGETFLTGSFGGTVSLWDTSTGRALSPPMWHQRLVRSAIFSPDGKSILSCARGTVRLREVPQSLIERKAAPLPPGLLPHAIDDLNRVVLVEDKNHHVQLMRVDTDELIGAAIEHPTTVLAAAVSRDLSKVATVGMDYKVRLWESSSGQLAAHLAAREHGFCVAFSPDGESLVSGHFGGTVLWWDAVTGDLKGQLRHQRHSGPIFAVQYSEDGKTILTSGADGHARLWKADSGEEVASIRHSATVLARLDPTGDTLLTCGSDQNVRLWNAKTLAPIGRTMSHSGYVFDARFSQDSTIICTGCSDKTVRLWDTATGKQIGPPWFHTNRVIQVGIWPDQNTVLSFTGNNDRLTSAHRDVHFWKMPPPLEGTDQEIEWWAQVVTGTELDPNGAVRPITDSEWQERTRQLRQTRFVWP